MLFPSITFLFLFLPILCLMYFVSKKNWKNYILLVASIIFYTYGEFILFPVMLLIILINYLGTMFFEDFPKYKRCILWCAVVANLSILTYFKYFDFIIENINALFSCNFTATNIVMPIGVSFYTFQAMSYLIDVYCGTVKLQRNFFKLSLYICLFPQLIAGPIVRYAEIEKQIDSRDEDFDTIVYGVKRFIIGLAKKVLIANMLGKTADKAFGLECGELSIYASWIGAISYSFQLFYDFSGYSDMAIGLGAIFGFKFPENFNYPYISKSITEFWKRWHMTLGNWFKDYLYIPIGGNKLSVNRTCLNLFVVFLATGIWHGASWNFVIWGLIHGMCVIIERYTNFHKKNGPFITVFQHIYTLFIVVIGWVIFRSDNLVHAANYLKCMFGFNQNISHYTIFYFIDVIETVALIAAIICSMPTFRNIFDRQNNVYIHTAVNAGLVVIFILSLAAVAASTYNPFIYFRF